MMGTRPKLRRSASRAHDWSVSGSLPEEEQPEISRKEQLGSQAGHAPARQHDGHCDWIVCGCGHFESQRHCDDMTRPFEEWERHARRHGAHFADRKHKTPATA